MNRQIILHAEAEIFEALAWYNERSGLAGRAFVQELTHAVRLAARAEQLACYIWRTRRVVFPRFPFDLVFRTKREAIEIVAVAHHRRRLYYWRSR